MTAEIEKLSENMEDYLEVIFALSREKGVARVGEIAEKMDVKSPSVNAALKALSDRDLVVHEKYGYVALTEAGRKLASAVQEKHDVLYRFLTEFLMISPDLADREACSIEHAISEETFIRLVKFFKFLESSVNGEKPRLLKNFEVYLKTGERLPCDCEFPQK
jgi:DtxR family Mn-dependent transcriptional regulator